MIASNLVGVISFKTTSCGCAFVEASKITRGFFPDLTKMPWAVWRQYGEKRRTQSLTGRRWLFLSSLFIVFFTISGYILKVAWFPFSMIVAFISDDSSKSTWWTDSPLIKYVWCALHQLHRCKVRHHLELEICFYFLLRTLPWQILLTCLGARNNKSFQRWPSPLVKTESLVDPSNRFLALSMVLSLQTSVTIL